MTMGKAFGRSNVCGSLPRRCVVDRLLFSRKGTKSLPVQKRLDCGSVTIGPLCDPTPEQGTLQHTVDAWCSDDKIR
jgi:hypothetical protein